MEFFDATARRFSGLNEPLREALDAYYATFKMQFLRNDTALIAFFDALIRFEGVAEADICGRLFASGDLVYHCVECAYDETCVYCADCFVATEHAGHAVSFFASMGNGGCCDCGDDESWRRPTPCSHATRSSGSQLAQFGDAATIGAFCAVLREHAAELFFVPMLEAAQFKWFEGGEEIGSSSSSQEAIDESGIQPPSSHNDSCVLLYNDEHHAFDAVIDAVAAALHCFQNAARSVAQDVDAVGRRIVFRGQRAACIAVAAAIVEKCDLSVRIVPFDVYVREEMLCFGWIFLRRICKFRVLRDEVLHVLFDARLRSSLPFFARSSEADWTDEDETTEHRLMEGDAAKEASSSPPPLLRQNTLLVEDLLGAGGSLWKEARGMLHDFFVGAVLIDVAHFKVQFGLAFCRCYGTLLESYAADREPQEAFVEIAVQLFTGPLIARTLISQTPIIETLLTLWEAEIGNDASFLPHKPRSMPNKRKPLTRILQDLCFLFSHAAVTDVIVAQTGLLERLLRLLQRYEAMHAQNRQLHAHVEFESRDWLHAFNMSMQLLPLIQHVARCLQPPHFGAIADFYVNFRMTPGRDYSFHHPLLWIVGFWLRLHTEETLPVLFGAAAVAQSMSAVLLHKFAFEAQIEASLWVRNGISIHNQLLNYDGRTMFNSCVLNDWLVFRRAFAAVPYCDVQFALLKDVFLAASDRHAVVVEELLVLLCRLISATDPAVDDATFTHQLAMGGCGGRSVRDLEDALPDALVNDASAFNALVEKYAFRRGDKIFLKPEHVASIDVTHIAAFSKSKRSSIATYVASVKEAPNVVYLNDVACNTHFKPLLLAVEAELLTAFSDEFRDIVEMLCCFLWRVRRQIHATFGDALVASPGKFLLHPALANHKALIDATFGVASASEHAVIDAERTAAAAAKRKKLAKQRQEAIKAQMKQAQLAFADAMNIDEQAATVDAVHLTDCCMICQETFAADSQHGFWCKQEKSSFEKYFFGVPSGCDDATRAKRYFSTCRHQLHLECYENITKFSNYISEDDDSDVSDFIHVKMFACPVCKSAGNFYLPVIDACLTPVPRIQAEEFLHDEASCLRRFARKIVHVPNAFVDRAYSPLLALAPRVAPLRNKWKEIFDCFVYIVKVAELAQRASKDAYDFGTFFDVNQRTTLQSLLLFLREAFFLLQSAEFFDGFVDFTQEIAERRSSSSEAIDRLAFMAVFGEFRSISEYQAVADRLLSAEACPFYTVIAIAFKSLVFDATDVDFVAAISTSQVKSAFGVPSLYRMPERLDLLMAEASTRKKCLVCDSEPHEVAICLICSSVTCPSQTCCQQGVYGECYAHRLKCGFDTCLYFHVRNNHILLLTQDNGMFIPLPYVDRHGMTSLHLKRSLVLAYSADHYDALTLKWIKHTLIHDAYQKDDNSIGPLSHLRWYAT